LKLKGILIIFRATIFKDTGNPNISKFLRLSLFQEPTILNRYLSPRRKPRDGLTPRPRVIPSELFRNFGIPFTDKR
jgi:hypothetical protein